MAEFQIVCVIICTCCCRGRLLYGFLYFTPSLRLRRMPISALTNGRQQRKKDIEDVGFELGGCGRPTLSVQHDTN